MTAKFEVGSIIEGKVTSIKPFGAFVALDEQKQGLVHISQVKNGFVKDINEVLSVGEEVKVKVLSVDEETGKISLSIREANPQAAKEEGDRPRKPRGAKKGGNKQQFTMPQEEQAPFNTMENQLKEWLEANKK